MTAADRSPPAGISSPTLARLERAAGGLATRAVALMDERLVWFRTLPASHRSWVTLVAQAGISGYVEWLSASEIGHDDGFRLTEAVFGTAPRELVRAVSLRRTVELVRIAISVAEEHFPALAESADERARLTDSLLRYSREVAFSAAAIYAAAAESRGAWDQRLEASVVDAIVRGESGDSLDSRAAALNWDTTLPVLAMVGAPGGAGQVVAQGGVAMLSGLHGDRLILIVAGRDPDDLQRAAVTVQEQFGPGPVMRGPSGIGLAGAIRSARHALSALRALAAWPGPHRIVESDALLAERVLAGDAEAADVLRRNVFDPLIAAGEPLVRTLDVYLATGRALEPAARELFVHANTIRYRLRRIADVTGLDPSVPRDALVLQLSLITGRLAGARQS